MITLEDLIQAWDALRSKRMKLGISAILFGSLLLGWLIFPVPGVIPKLLFGGALGLIVGALSIERFFRHRAKWARETLVRMGGTEGMEYRFDRDSCAFKTPLIEARQAWSALWGYRETADAFLLFPMKLGLNVVPKRAFSAEEQVLLRGLLTGISPNRPPNLGPLLSRQTLLLMVGVGFVQFAGYVFINLQLIERRFDDPVERSNRIVRSTSFAVERWRKKNAPTDCPTIEQLSQAQHMNALQSSDGWRRSLQLTCDGLHFSVRSAGLDGHFGTADDIVASDADPRLE